MSKDFSGLIKARWNRNRKPEYRIDSLEQLAEPLKRGDPPTVNWFFSELTIEEIVFFGRKTHVSLEQVKKLYFSDVNYQRSELFDYFFKELIAAGSGPPSFRRRRFLRHQRKMWEKRLIPAIELISRWLDENVGRGNHAFGGETALSLFYLRHRSSEDLDFFLRFEKPILRERLATRIGQST